LFAPQVGVGAAQLPHEYVLVMPQLSAAVTLPQLFPSRAQNAVEFSDVHVPPHTFGIPSPPQVADPVHVPHEVTVRIVPQLSRAITVPQFLP
jgi:hypothetical protein